MFASILIMTHTYTLSTYWIFRMAIATKILHVHTRTVRDHKIGCVLPVFSLDNCSVLWLQNLHIGILIKEYVGSVLSCFIAAEENAYMMLVMACKLDALCQDWFWNLHSERSFVSVSIIAKRNNIKKRHQMIGMCQHFDALKWYEKTVQRLQRCWRM